MEKNVMGQEGKYLTLSLGNERYAVEIMKVQEIVSVPEITRVPRCPEFVRGVINLRGRIIPVVELRRKLGLESIQYGEHACIIIVGLDIKEKQVSIGVMVDAVIEVSNFQGSEIQPPPDALGTDTSYIIGIGKRPNSPLCLLLDIDGLLLLEDIGALTQQEWQSWRN